MTKEELKQLAEAEADKVIIGSGMDMASVIHLKHLLVTMYVQGANLILPQLTEKNKQIEELKKIAEFQTSLSMQRFAELKKKDKALDVAEKLNRSINAMNKKLEEDCDKFTNMVFDKEGKIKELEALIEELKKTNSETLAELNHINGDLILEVAEKDKEIEELKANNKVYCIGEGETLVINTTFNEFTRINANKKMYYPHDTQLKELEEKDKQIEELHKELADYQFNYPTIKELEAQIEQSKEMLKKWLGDFYSPLKCEKRAELIGQTEQFLGERK